MSLTTTLAKREELSEGDIDRLYDLMVHAYEVTEVEIWGENYVRMSRLEFEGLIDRCEIIIAKMDDELVGSIHTSRLSGSVFVFGLLSADFALKGMGIGRALISAAEERAKQQGATCMSLEILRPRDFEVPVKNVLRDWYLRLGYRYTKSVSFVERKPDKADKAARLIVPSVFDCYEKQL